MPSLRLEDPSPFVRLAIKLDNELSELTRAGKEIEGVDIESDNGLDQGVKILNRVAHYGQSLAETMQEFSKSLLEAQRTAEAAARLVAERGQLIKQRNERESLLQETLSKLKEQLKTVGTGLAGFARTDLGEPSAEDKRQIAAALEKLQAPIDRFIEAAQKIKDEAGRSKFKRVEHQAAAIIDSLQASRRKITDAIAPK